MISGILNKALASVPSRVCPIRHRPRLVGDRNAATDPGGGTIPLACILTTRRDEVRERPVSTRLAPLDDPHLINGAYSNGTLSTASKRHEVMAGLLRASPVRW
jgi:hypothetical protein